MTGIKHRFIAGIRAQTETQYLVQRPSGQRFETLHVFQGNEGICGPISLLQATLVLCGWPRSRAVNRNPRSEPLRTFWRRVRELYSEGTDERDLSSLATLLAPAIGFDLMTSRSAKRIGSAAASAIDAGHVPIVRFTAATYSHWSTVVGVECSASGAVLALLLLDTSTDPPWAAFFNARLELLARTDARKPFVLPLRYDDGRLWRTHLDSLFVVKRGDQPLERT
jgi:hypothetical protein